jgi:hypothetical protein
MELNGQRHAPLKQYYEEIINIFCRVSVLKIIYKLICKEANAQRKKDNKRMKI